MLTELEGPLLWAVYLCLGALSLSLLGAFIRVLRGPSLPDRVVGLDLVGHLTIGFLGSYALLSGEETYVDVALVLGLLAFLGTIALARYIEQDVDRDVNL